MKFSASLVLPDSNRFIPFFHKSLISMLLLSIKQYPFTSQICFDKRFTCFTFLFKYLSHLQIIGDTSLTP